MEGKFLENSLNQAAKSFFLLGFERRLKGVKLMFDPYQFPNLHRIDLVESSGDNYWQLELSLDSKTITFRTDFIKRTLICFFGDEGLIDKKIDIHREGELNPIRYAVNLLPMVPIVEMVEFLMLGD